MEKKSVSVRISEEEARQLKLRAEQANMNLSEYMRCSIMQNQIQVIDRSRQLYDALWNIHTAIVKEERQHRNCDFSAIREEVLKACQLLKP